MNTEKLTWYVARSGGIVAWVLLALALVLGLLLSSRILGRRASPAWILSVHRFLGGLSVVFTGVHVAAIMLDDFVDFGFSDVLVPWASEWRPGPVAWGVIAMYLAVAIELTSFAMKRLPRRLWRAVHWTSAPLFVMATVHGWQAGTDAGRAFIVAIVTSMVVLVALTIVRIVAARRRGEPRDPLVLVAEARRRKTARSDPSGSHTDDAHAPLVVAPATPAGDPSSNGRSGPGVEPRPEITASWLGDATPAASIAWPDPQPLEVELEPACAEAAPPPAPAWFEQDILTPPEPERPPTPSWSSATLREGPTRPDGDQPAFGSLAELGEPGPALASDPFARDRSAPEGPPHPMTPLDEDLAASTPAERAPTTEPRPTTGDTEGASPPLAPSAAAEPAAGHPTGEAADPSAPMPAWRLPEPQDPMSWVTDRADDPRVLRREGPVPGVWKRSRRDPERVADDVERRPPDRSGGRGTERGADDRLVV